MIKQGEVYYGKEKDSVSVIMPLRDRNGDVIAAARVVMKPFAGQTEQNAIARALIGTDRVDLMADHSHA